MWPSNSFLDIREDRNLGATKLEGLGISFIFPSTKLGASSQTGSLKTPVIRPESMSDAVQIISPLSLPSPVFSTGVILIPCPSKPATTAAFLPASGNTISPMILPSRLGSGRFNSIYKVELSSARSNIVPAKPKIVPVSLTDNFSPMIPLSSPLCAVQLPDPASITSAPMIGNPTGDIEQIDYRRVGSGSLLAPQVRSWKKEPVTPFLAATAANLSTKQVHSSLGLGHPSENQNFAAQNSLQPLAVVEPFSPMEFSNIPTISPLANNQGIGIGQRSTALLKRTTSLGAVKPLSHPLSPQMTIRLVTKRCHSSSFKMLRTSRSSRRSLFTIPESPI